ncbi:DUF6308 family protein [Nocardioides astragali]|uniref:DUF6308 family protein n=1 Tax=Nocardioides astragali TaxID=1776736 RepID=A0ABW2N5Z7_9ACTN|nr:DUF6308 family protein [Nocardioides astragali]
MRLPQLLQSSDDSGAVSALQRYYSLGEYSDSDPFTGARFDDWDSTLSRSEDVNRFTADDLVAVSLLSVYVPPAAAIELLDTGAAKFSRLLRELGGDRDLVEETQAWSDAWAGWRLWSELTALPGVGATTASKLLARKRPRLRPIYDSVVATVIDSQDIWAPLRKTLNELDDLHPRLLRLREQAGLTDAVSALRVFDVVAWMEGKGAT